MTSTLERSVCPFSLSLLIIVNTSLLDYTDFSQSCHYPKNLMKSPGKILTEISQENYQKLSGILVENRAPARI